MSALKKEEVLSQFYDLIDSVSSEEKMGLARKLRKIKENVEKLLEQAED
ncbi:hypothetical protein [Bacillus sp. FJAT-29814]|nr:hypothetical protein [Bacillus sp. FJAT-29814]